MIDSKLIDVHFKAICALTKEYAAKNNITILRQSCSWNPGGTFNMTIRSVIVDRKAKPVTPFRDELHAGLSAPGTRVVTRWEGEWYYARILSRAPRADKYIIEFEGEEGKRYRCPFTSVYDKIPAGK